MIMRKRTLLFKEVSVMPLKGIAAQPCRVEEGLGDCFDPRVGELVNDYLFDDLTADETAWVETHLFQCASCKEFVSFAKGAFGRLREGRKRNPVEQAGAETEGEVLEGNLSGCY